MEIQWVIIARSYQMISGNLSIDNAINQFTIYGGINKASLFLITKVLFNPAETLENRVLTIKISHDKMGELYSFENTYQIPNLSTLVNMITYLVYPLSLEFPDTGKYTFAIFIDGEYKNEESIDVIHKELKDARIQSN
jgi:hypothetical protein